MMHYKWKRFGLHKLIMLILFSVCLASEIVLHKYENITISKHISSDATFGFESKACGRGVLGKWKSFLRTRQPQLLFEEYDKLIVSKLSTFAAACETKYPFIYFGASDGNPDHDRHVRKFYSMSHWQGLFVEASEPKIANWTKNLNWFEASDRSLVVHAAVHNKCPREKIGFVVSGNPVASTTVGHVRLKDNSFGETVNWTVEQVPCMTPVETVQQFSTHFEHRKDFVVTTKAKSPHIASLLKIHTDRTSVLVLRSLLNALHVWELPLVIILHRSAVEEEKEPCPESSAYLASMGYVVSPCGPGVSASANEIVAYIKPKLLR